MSIIRQWGAAHGIPLAALVDLETRMGIAGRLAMGGELKPPHGVGEARQQSLVILEAAKKQVRLFRNNSGAFRDDNGQLVRFGVGNTSKAFNEVMKSPDLIGWRKREITQDMVGSVIGQACMREMKDADWTYTGTPHERAQLNWLELATADGCDAGFATGPGTL